MRSDGRLVADVAQGPAWRRFTGRQGLRAWFAGLSGLALMVIGPALSAETPVAGGTLVYLEQQAHTNLYSPAGGFYPNGGVLNQITDKLTYQNPKTLEIQPYDGASK